jgi:Chaperone of endosialidase
MKSNRSPFLVAAMILAIAAPTAVYAQVAEPSGGGDTITWNVKATGHSSIELRVQCGDAYVSKSFKNGKPVSLSVRDFPGDSLEQSSCSWEMFTVMDIPSGVAKKLSDARKAGDDKAASKILKAAGISSSYQSGGLQYDGNGFVALGGTEGSSARNVSTNEAPAAGGTPGAGSGAGRFQPRVNDQVIPDDLIVQGSGCFGFDCVNNESFGFDTIRLKENNLRIKAEDTSVSPYPTNDWQLTFNDSASGGTSKFSVEDITGAKVPLTIVAGASTNAIYVDSTGRIGARTSTPVLDFHISTSNTPAIRLEQTNAGGFTAQTWDVAGNEANFFVRDVTGGSRLPFRIRPGAPTSSVDISASGNVGIGTASPDFLLDVENSSTSATINRTNANNASGIAILRVSSGNGSSSIRQSYVDLISDEATDINWKFGMFGDASFRISDYTSGAEANRMTFASNGNIGLGGNLSPTSPLHHSNGAILTAGGTWQSVSSREAKMDISALTVDEAKAAFEKLQPVKFTYKLDPNDPQVGFIAEDVPDLVATHDRKHLNAMEITAVLTDVVKEQQKTIEELQKRLEQLEKQQK